MVFVFAYIVPFGLIIIESGMNLNWASMTAQVFLAPFLTPLFLTIFWSGAQGPALIAGTELGVLPYSIAILEFIFFRKVASFI